MSLERELLGRAMSLIDYRYAPSEAVAVHREIQELLAQPEQPKQEPLSEEESYHEAKRLYESEDGLWYQDGFIDGLKFAEKMHGIGGGE